MAAHAANRIKVQDDSKNCVKILECLSKEAPEALALEATREFKARAADRRFAGAVAGQRDLPAGANPCFTSGRCGIILFERRKFQNVLLNRKCLVHLLLLSAIQICSHKIRMSLFLL